MQIDANGISIAYELAGPGDAPVVVLSHSLATNFGMWSPQFEALQRNYRVLRYDTRGHGRTSAPAGAYDLETLAADAVALLDALDMARVNWVGLSMGGMIGQVMALDHGDRIGALALCDTASAVPAAAASTWDERISIPGRRAPGHRAPARRGHERGHGALQAPRGFRRVDAPVPRARGAEDLPCLRVG